MGYCKKCFDHLSNDCMLTNGECVFCHYQTKAWDSNGRFVSKKEALESLEIGLVWPSYLQRYVRDLAKAIKHSPRGAVKDRLKRKLEKTERFLKSRQFKKSSPCYHCANKISSNRGKSDITANKSTHHIS